MNSVTAVLLALVLIAVILLIVWLVLRSRSADLPSGTAPDVPWPPAAPAAPDSMPYGAPRAELDERPAGSLEGGGDDEVRDDEVRDAEVRDDEVREHASARGADDAVDSPPEVAPAAVEEFVDPGLSDLEEDEIPEPVAEDGDLSGTPPRTPAEAFGPAHAHPDDVDHEAASRETSVLDEQDVDSTPLFRSIREELLGSGFAAGSDPAGEALSDDAVGQEAAMDTTAEDEPTEEHGRIAAVEAQEHVWTETVTDEGVETGAAGTGTLEPAAEEEELSTTNDTTAEQIGSAAVPGAAGEHPPIRRISELHEVIDGGFGIGSAKALEDGAQPLGHPIKANVDTKTYQDLHSPWYDETEPDVWFLDAGFAERAGFHRAE